MPVTIIDIARRVGKSITTVSRALHDYDDVSPETKQLVRRVAAEMGYTPSTLAQRLQKQRSDTLGLILPTFGPRFSDPFFSEFLAGVGNVAAEIGYDLLVSTRAPGEAEMTAYRKNVQSRRVDGFIVVRTRRQDPRIEYLSDSDFPFIAFGRTGGDLDFPFVDEDSFYGMGLVVEHLVSLGHRRIACISAPADLMFAEHRLKGLRAGLSTHDMSIPAEMIREGDLTQRGGYQQASGLLEHPQPPTAIVACNDLMALGAVSLAQERGMVVGRDISITGFDDIPMAEHAHPPLTTLRQPIYQIGRLICEMLVQILQGETLERRQVLLQPELVVRSSTGRAPS
ncbi:MAG TPA: LacI family DNA-binding transcriptional regulator [Anaerolineales bacterium]|nr:LacI family DNA-binding transcriptional regulator [Anaerolineales bacterium]